METWIEREQNALLTEPATSSEDMMQRNVLIGEMRGHKTVLGLPQALIDNITATIDGIKERESEHSDDSDE